MFMPIATLDSMDVPYTTIAIIIYACMVIHTFTSIIIANENML